MRFFCRKASSCLRHQLRSVSHCKIFQEKSKFNDLSWDLDGAVIHFLLWVFDLLLLIGRQTTRLTALSCAVALTGMAFWAETDHYRIGRPLISEKATIEFSSHTPTDGSKERVIHQLLFLKFFFLRLVQAGEHFLCVISLDGQSWARNGRKR